MGKDVIASQVLVKWVKKKKIVQDGYVDLYFLTSHKPNYRSNVMIRVLFCTEDNGLEAEVFSHTYLASYLLCTFIVRAAKYSFPTSREIKWS